MAKHVVTEGFVRMVRRMRDWQRHFSVTGDGVTMTKTEDACAIRVAWPADQRNSKKLKLVRVRPTSAATKSGTYYGKIQNAPAGAFDSTASGTLAHSDFGVDGADCTIINADEEGQPGHELVLDGSFMPLDFIGIIIGTDTSNGNPLIRISGDQWEACS